MPIVAPIPALGRSARTARRRSLAAVNRNETLSNFSIQMPDDSLEAKYRKGNGDFTGRQLETFVLRTQPILNSINLNPRRTFRRYFQKSEPRSWEFEGGPSSPTHHPKRNSAYPASAFGKWGVWRTARDGRHCSQPRGLRYPKTAEKPHFSKIWD